MASDIESAQNDVDLLREKLMQRDVELQYAREELALTILQLDQVEDELEHYFSIYQSVQRLLPAQQDQLHRAQVLMKRLLPEAASTPIVERLDVEVLAPLAPSDTVQTEALLSSYASIVHRAELLLRRALRR